MGKYDIPPIPKTVVRETVAPEIAHVVHFQPPDPSFYGTGIGEFLMTPEERIKGAWKRWREEKPFAYASCMSSLEWFGPQWLPMAHDALYERMFPR